MDYCPVKDVKCGGPNYDPQKWKFTEEEHELNNCYSYALNQIETDLLEKRQPGFKCNKDLSEDYSCKNLDDMIKCDYPDINKLDNINSWIPCDHYKIALAVDVKGEYIDYHFYRQDSNGYWSHKSGYNPISNIDASGNLIKDPGNIDRNYDKEKNDEYNYDIFCGYYSVQHR